MTAADAQTGRRAEEVCRQALGPAGVDGAGVALVTPRGARATVCATDAVAALIETAQFTLGEGPCVDAAGTGSPVLVHDLDDRSHGVQDRWPGFLDAAAGSGVRAVFAFPLRIGAVAFGALDLYRSTPGPLDAQQLRAALLAADEVALLLLDLVTGAEHLGEAPGGAHAAWHMQVHRAAGTSMVQLGTTIEVALARLRALAFAEGRSIDEVALDVLDGTIRFTPEEDA